MGELSDGARETARKAFACAKSYESHELPAGPWRERMRNAWAAYHAGAPWMTQGMADAGAALLGENARLRAEVERLEQRGCSDCRSTGYDGSNPCCSCRGTGNVDEARALAERDKDRADTERLRSGIADLRKSVLGKYHPASEVGAEMSGVVACLDALTREDGEG